MMKTNQRKFLLLLAFLLVAFVSPVKSAGDYVNPRLTMLDDAVSDCLDENLTSNEEMMAPCDKKWALYKPYVTTTSVKLSIN